MCMCCKKSQRMYKLWQHVLCRLYRKLAQENKVFHQKYLNLLLRECPNRCPVSQGTIRPIGKALLRIYNDLDIQCCYYDKCGKIVKLSDLEQHERVCQLPKCANFELCGNHAKPVIKNVPLRDLHRSLIKSKPAAASALY